MTLTWVRYRYDGAGLGIVKAGGKSELETVLEEHG
jgi:hypothetical protein